MTYNHEKYLADALEGFVMQKTNFPFVAVVIDDFSTDGTADILRQYEAKYPDIIKAVYLQENYYSQHKSKKPFLDPYDSQSKYIAICEGDDYWTDPYKLQKQVDYLETHEDCVMCCHAANIEINAKIEGNDRRHTNECDLTTDEVIAGTGLYVAMASTIYKNSAIPSGEARPQWWKMADVGDYPLHIYGTLIGKLHYFPEIMSVYRYQRPGSWTEANTKQKNLKHEEIEYSWFMELDKVTTYMYHRSICTAMFGYAADLYINRRITFAKYLRMFGGTKNKKKINHLLKTMVARFLKIEINTKLLLTKQ